MEVTVLIFSSRGAKSHSGNRVTHHTENCTAQECSRNDYKWSGCAEAFFIRNGTAIPTKEIGPAKAVTVADKILESKIKSNAEEFDVYAHALCISFSQLISTDGL